VGFFVFARPQYRPPHQGTTIRIPDKQPAQDAGGRQGWTWAEGVPGWEPGQKIGDYRVSGVQSIEVDPARLVAARMGLDAEQVRVVTAMRQMPGVGPLAIYAAPSAYASYESKAIVCLGVDLPGAATTQWFCPGSTHPGPDVARSHVLVAASALEQRFTSGEVALGLVGLARGDVYRVVLHIPGQKQLPNATLYDRGKTWGQFETAVAIPAGAGVPELRVYAAKGRLVQTLPLELKPGEARIVQ
jgi:hypothetical protein